MFFPEKIKTIKPGDKVLEIGPGGTPYSRADVFLDLDPKCFKSEEEERMQRGLAPVLLTEKPVVFYNGKKFPFKDKEFEYVICSHVLEHVKDLGFFLSEMFRVAKRGYVEYPTIYYEYLYNFSVHINFLKFKEGVLLFMRKSNSHLNEFSPVQDFFTQTLIKEYQDIVNDLGNFMFEGFEWSSPFQSREVSDIKELVWDNLFVPLHVNRPAGILPFLKTLLLKLNPRSIIRKLNEII